MNTKNKLIVFLVLLLGSVYARATSVTATITDSDSQAWANCKWTVVLNNPRPDITPSAGGTPLTSGQITQSGTCNGSGVLSVTLVDSTTISPVGTTWRFTISPNASSQGGSGATAVSGSSQNLSVFLSGIAPVVRFSPGPSSYGYADGEIVGTPLPGQTYYNVTTPAFRQWSGSAWATVGGGGGGAPNPGTLNALYKSDGAGGWTISAFSDNGSTVSSSSLSFGAPAFTTPTGIYIGPGGSASPGYDVITFQGASGSALNNFLGIVGNPTTATDKNLYFNTPQTGTYVFRGSDGSTFGLTTYLTISNTATTSSAGVYPSISAAATVSQAVCVKAAGPPIVIGTCSTVVGSGGACTCN